jgi:hypothetical protein
MRLDIKDAFDKFGVRIIYFRERVRPSGQSDYVVNADIADVINLKDPDGLRKELDAFTHLEVIQEAYSVFLFKAR